MFFGAVHKKTCSLGFGFLCTIAASSLKTKNPGTLVCQMNGWICSFTFAVYQVEVGFDDEPCSSRGQ